MAEYLSQVEIKIKAMKEALEKFQNFAKGSSGTTNTLNVHGNFIENATGDTHNYSGPVTQKGDIITNPEPGRLPRLLT
ncbi:hypothetical protein LQZ19_15850 [Treponema primitia]|uniref:hypothetical protein n=1 Tax=Treponema primitia TaxID=88058 RepID=UPI00397F6A07